LRARDDEAFLSEFDARLRDPVAWASADSWRVKWIPIHRVEREHAVRDRDRGRQKRPSAAVGRVASGRRVGMRAGKQRTGGTGDPGALVQSPHQERFFFWRPDFFWESSGTTGT
jgi:hypothetical protein